MTTTDVLRTLLAHLPALCRTARTRADRLHPAALVGLVLVLLALGWAAGTVLVSAFIAVVLALAAIVKTLVVLAAGWLLARLAYRLASRIPHRHAH